MGETTGISWTDSTWNPWWGCVKVSEGCTNCYAETLSKRTGGDFWGPNSLRRFFNDKHWNEPVNWNKKAEAEGKRRKVFCGSMCDWAEDRPDLILPRQRLFDLIEHTPWLDWLMLTKRPENIIGMVPGDWLSNPRPNVWMGTSTENQKWADERIPLLLQVPARVRFLSAEPLLGPVDLRDYFTQVVGWDNDAYENDERQAIHWVIVGGESGPKARPMHPQWARDLRDQCKAAGVAFFMKQWGGWTPYFPQGISLANRKQTYFDGVEFYHVGKALAGDKLDGEIWHEFPATN